MTENRTYNRHSDPAGEGEAAARSDYRAAMAPTTFPTIAETKKAMREDAKRMLHGIEEIYKITLMVARGADPETQINFERRYTSGQEVWPTNIRGLADEVENGLNLMMEYRCEIKTLRGRGITE
jgi:hypothetical protein